MYPEIILTKNSKKRSVDLVKNNRYQYPFDVNELTLAYVSNPYHNQCIEIKTMNIAGKGLNEQLMQALEDATPKMSAYLILYATILDLQIYGNAYWEIVKINNNQHQIFHVPAQTMTLRERGFTQTVGEQKVEFTNDQVYHFKYISPLSTIYGAPDYLSILESLMLSKKIIRYNDSYFDNNAIPDMAMIVEGGEMSPTALSAVRTFFRDKFQGVKNAHRLLYLPVREGMKVDFEKLQADQRDASYLNFYTQTRDDIIVGHRVPPRLLGIVSAGSLGGGGEATGQMEIFYETLIYPRQQILAGMLDELNKKHKIFNENSDFSITPIVLKDTSNNPLDELLRR